MNNTIKFLVKKVDNGKRADIFLSKKINNLTRSFLKKLIKKNLLKINNKIVSSPSVKLKTNDNVEIKIIYDLEQKLIPKKIKLDIVYEDKDILGRNFNYKKIESDNTYPEFILNNREVFKKWIL